MASTHRASRISMTTRASSRQNHVHMNAVVIPRSGETRIDIVNGSAKTTAGRSGVGTVLA